MYFDLIILILSSQTLGQNANFSLSQLKECVSGPIIWSNCRMPVFLSQWFKKYKLYSIHNFYIRLEVIFMTILEPLVLGLLSSMEHGLGLTQCFENGSSKKILGILQELTHFQMGLVEIRSRGISIEFSRETMIRWYKWWKELRHLRIY